MNFTVENMFENLNNTYRIAEVLDGKIIKGEGCILSDEYTFLDIVRDDYFKYLLCLGYSSGDLTLREASLINFLSKREVNLDSFYMIYRDLHEHSSYRDYTKIPPHMIEIVVEFENNNKGLLNNFPSMSRLFCKTLDEMGTAFLSMFNDENNHRKNFHDKAMQTLKNYLNEWNV